MKRQVRPYVDCPECDGLGGFESPCLSPDCEDGKMLDPDFTVNDGRRAFSSRQRIPCGRRLSKPLGLRRLRADQFRRRLERLLVVREDRAAWPPRQPTDVDRLELQAMQGAYMAALRVMPKPTGRAA